MQHSPFGPFTGTYVKPRIGLTPILRAGIAMTDALVSASAIVLAVVLTSRLLAVNTIPVCCYPAGSTYCSHANTPDPLQYTILVFSAKRSHYSQWNVCQGSLSCNIRALMFSFRLLKVAPRTAGRQGIIARSCSCHGQYRMCCPGYDN